MTTRRPNDCSDDCSRFERWLTPFVDGELDAVHTIEVEEHLELCESCHERVSFVRAMRGSLREEARSQAPSSLRTRLQATIAEQLAAEDEVGETSTTAGVLDLDDEQRDSSTSDAPHAVSASRRTPKLVQLRYVFPLAAAAVFVMVLGAVKYQADSSDAPTARRINPGLSVSPLATADGFSSPVLAS